MTLDLFPQSANEIAALSPAELAEMDAWFAFLDEVEAGWERFADAVDTGAI
jgi:hypothetical protein